MKARRCALTLVEAVAAAVVGVAMVAGAFSAYGQLEERLAAERRGFDRERARARALSVLAADLEATAEAAPLRSPAVVLLAVEGGAVGPALQLDGGRVRWTRDAAGVLRNGVLQLDGPDEWRVLLWDAGGGRLMESSAASHTRATLPLRVGVRLDGASVERDLR